MYPSRYKCSCLGDQVAKAIKYLQDQTGPVGYEDLKTHMALTEDNFDAVYLTLDMGGVIKDAGILLTEQFAKTR